MVPHPPICGGEVSLSHFAHTLDLWGGKLPQCVFSVAYTLDLWGGRRIGAGSNRMLAGGVKRVGTSPLYERGQREGCCAKKKKQNKAKMKESENLREGIMLPVYKINLKAVCF